jgi:putative protease
MNNPNKIEIMSPAGSFDSLQAAIQGGAGSIYFGAGNLNMRSNSSNNFTLDDIREIANICNSNNIKSYLTVNSIIYDEELDRVQEVLQIAKESNISAIIASDMAVIDMARDLNLEVHISTQLNVCNYAAVKYYSRFADVIVLARELSLDKVAHICEKIKENDLRGPSGELIRIEIFVHGALCMAVSGKCYLSLHEKNYSANRGACLQTCRRAYTVKDKDTGYELEIDNQFIMSPKDLCTIGFLDKILDAGVSVLKIEGRGRAPEYVKTVTQCYKEAVEAYQAGEYSDEKIEAWTEKLKEVFNRGFWDGYYLGRKLGEWSDRYGSRATKRKVQIGKAMKYYSKVQAAVFKLESESLSVGDDILIIGPTTGALEHKLTEIRVDDKLVESIEKGIQFSIPFAEKIRPNDKLFKVVSAEKIKQQ